MRKIFTVLLSMLLMITVTTSGFATERSDLQTSLGDIQKSIETYFQENNMNIQVGSEEFYAYVKEQLFEHTDEELRQNKDYDLITAYFVEYYNSYNDYELCSGLSDLNQQTIKIMSENPCITYNAIKKEFSFRLSNAFLSTTLDEIKKQNQELQRDIMIAAVSPQAVNYSSTKAVKYARQYALGWNTVYPKYSADCTNFVSQCLRAGGIPMVGTKTVKGTYSTTTDWFCQYTTYNPDSKLDYDDHAVSTSWIRTTDFRTYMSGIASSKKTYSTVSGLISACKAGDVIQLCHKSTGSPYHTIIVSEKSGNSASYCGHSNAASNKDIASNLDDSTDKFILYRF